MSQVRTRGRTPRGRGTGSSTGRGGYPGRQKLSPGYTANNRLLNKPKDPVSNDGKGDRGTDVDMDVDANENVVAAPKSYKYKKVNRNPLELNLDIECICFRPLKRVTCCICGFFTEGMLRKVCALHPRDIYLLDVVACPDCGVPTRLMQELNFPASYQTTAKNRKIS